MTTLKKRRTSKLSDLDVTVYTTPRCTGCPKTLRTLRDHQVPHTVIDLSTDKAAYSYITQDLQYRQAPVVQVHNGWEQATWSGHRPELIADFILEFHNPMRQPADHDDSVFDQVGIDMAPPTVVTPIASSYNTGRSTGPHLGWQINKGQTSEP